MIVFESKINLNSDIQKYSNQNLIWILSKLFESKYRIQKIANRISLVSDAMNLATREQRMRKRCCIPIQWHMTTLSRFWRLLGKACVCLIDCFYVQPSYVLQSILDQMACHWMYQTWHSSRPLLQAIYEEVVLLHPSRI